MKRKKDIYKTLHQSNRSRNTRSFIILLVFAALLIGTALPFMFWPTFGIYTQKRYFANEEFDKIQDFAITDGNGYIEFLDKNLNVVYPKNTDKQYTNDDIDNMVDLYCIDQKVQEYRYIKDGQVYTEILSWTSKDENGWFLKLDEDLNYIDSANFTYLKDKYTLQDVDYILNEYINNAKIYKYNFTSNSGDQYTMVVTLNKKIQLFENYEILILCLILVIFLFSYALFTTLSIKSTSRAIKEPLLDLTNAITDFSCGKYVLLNKKYKIEEFNTIVNTFNGMVKTLKSLEQKNVNLEQQKRALFANISHDLKTPITIILGYADVLKSKKLSDSEKMEYIEKIYSKSELLSKLVNEFANYNKLNHPDFKLNLETKNLCDVVRNYFVDNYNYIIDNEFKIVVDIPEENYTCKIDEINFQRCLENLLSNFIKYNKKGTTIHTSIKSHLQYYEITLENNGTKIDDALAENLFEPLIMGDSSRNSDSSGLGLSVTKKIIVLHGGDIKYTSGRTYTNSFIIRIPKS